MIIGERLRVLRESKKLSQGDVEKRTGLLRCYTSRVENGHTIPSVETLEKYAQAMGVPLYEIFYEDRDTPKPLHVPKASESNVGTLDPTEWSAFVKLLGRINEQDRRILYFMAKKMSQPTFAANCSISIAFPATSIKRHYGDSALAAESPSRNASADKSAMAKFIALL